MIRGAPSISTSGIAGDSTVRKYGRVVFHLAGGAQHLLAFVAANLGEDVDYGGHIG